MDESNGPLLIAGKATEQLEPMFSVEVYRMTLLELVERFHEGVERFETPEALSLAMTAICDHAGFRHFAITHHTPAPLMHGGVRIHNYPTEWVRHFDEHQLGGRDPVHRASQLRGSGFSWSSLSGLIDMTVDDYDVLNLARGAGIGEGYTIPFHLPGEHSGSCSFAVGPNAKFPLHHVPLAQALGAFAFEAARGLCRRGHAAQPRTAHLTSREREIVVWLGHGKQEKQIARLLGISPSTVNDHLKHARARYGVNKSSLLVVCGLLGGSITYSELLTA